MPGYYDQQAGAGSAPGGPATTTPQCGNQCCKHLLSINIYGNPGAALADALAAEHAVKHGVASDAELN